MPTQEAIGQAYDLLYRRLKETGINNAGATAASKVLFAVIPRSAVMWDSRIREELGLGTGNSRELYERMLRHACHDVEELRTDAGNHGVPADEIPARLGRHGETLLKLVDEYHYITVTAGHRIPDQETLRHWLMWAG
jgi:hypothetical protein